MMRASLAELKSQQAEKRRLPHLHQYGAFNASGTLLFNASGTLLFNPSGTLLLNLIFGNGRPKTSSSH